MGARGECRPDGPLSAVKAFPLPGADSLDISIASDSGLPATFALATKARRRRQERWRPVVGFEAFYEVSDLGRLRRNQSGRGTRAGRLVSGSVRRDGYFGVSLYVGGQRHARLLHRLVAEAFLGTPASGLEVNHKDMNRSNTRAENLEWVTRSENAFHSFRNGRIPSRGTSRPTCKLTPEQVLEIRSSPDSTRTLAARYGVHHSSVWAIKHQSHWAFLQPEDSPFIAPRSTKLTAEKAADIRALYALGGLLHRDIATWYGVHKATVGKVLGGKAWAA